MPAQRKFQDPAPAPRVHWPAAEEEQAWSPRLTGFVPGQTPPSPAHLLWDELAARLQEQPPVQAAAEAIAPAVVKWPMPLRLGVIAALSFASWAAVYWAAVAII